MKPNIKVGSFLLAIVMMFSVFAIAGCTPTTLNKEWSYKTSDNELAIGVYIYSLNAAYSQAESYAKKLDDYDSTSDKWLDEKIKDDDGNEQVAREWIKDQAKKMCLSYLVVDEQLKKENVNIGQATLGLSHIHRLSVCKEDFSATLSMTIRESHVSCLLVTSHP